jgi:spore coat protein A
MGAKSRRDFLGLCFASVPAFALAKSGSNETSRPVYRTPASLERYIDPLPIPKRLKPNKTSQGAIQYRIRILECRQQLHSQLPPTTIWGFEGQYPGPTIEALQNRAIEVRWENHLPARHLFEIDGSIHGAVAPAPPVRTVPHLHGSRTRSASDGLPEKWFTPGASALYFYPNCQLPATLWYHDHAVGVTRLNVYAGLSGFYLLRNEEERKMNLPAGDYEIPLLLQDRTLDEQGQLAYVPTMENGEQLPPGVWGPEFFGELPVVNGAIYPYLEVEPRRYRLRVLNGANSRFFHLYLNLAKRVTDIPSLVPFHQIGTDGGLLPNPVALNKLLLAPAERADLVVDFSGLEGRIVTLANDAPAPFPGWDQINSRHPKLYELMQFRVTRPLSSKESSFSISTPMDSRGLDESKSVMTRDFVLSEKIDGHGRSLGVRINSKGYDDPVTERVTLGSTEKWRFINTTDDAHPMHLHLVQFKILERQGFNPATVGAGALELLGSPRPPAANEAGWKDTAVVQPRDVLTILVCFEGYAGRYVYHCHMLEHEDNDMMRPYEVVDEAQLPG